MLATVGIGAGGLIVGLAVSRLSLWLAALDGEAARATSLKRDLVLSLFGGGLGVWAASASPSLMIAAVSAVLAWQLLMLAVVDGEHFWLPDVLTWPLVVTGLVAEAADRLVDGAVGPPLPLPGSRDWLDVDVHAVAESLGLAA